MATVSNMQADLMGNFLTDAVGRWKKGGVKGFLRETGKAANVAREVATGNIGALTSLIPGGGGGSAPAPAPAPGFDFSFKNPVVKYGAIGGGVLVLLLLLKK
jgi:hypothetical protein